MIRFRPATLIYLTLLSFILVSYSIQQQWYQKGNPHFINEKQFNRLVTNQETRNKGVTILKFFTPWCRYCKYLKDIIDHLMKEGKWAITVLQVNCDEENYMFCGNMGVQSFPKMIVFEDGQWRENMDGFYPLEVVRDLFKRYNRTIVEEVKKKQGKVQGKEQKQEAPKQINPKPTLREEPPRLDEVKPKLEQKDNFIEPQVIMPSQQPKQQQPKPQEQPKTQQLPKPSQPKATQQKGQQVKQQQPQPHEPTQPQLTQPHPTPLRQPTNSHKPQQFIQQQQNIAVIDQDLAQTQHQKKIVQQAQKQKHQSVQTIDLTKTIHEHIVSGNYGKYLIYAICVVVGGYYFVTIMKGDATGNTHQGKSPSSKNINISRYQQQEIQSSRQTHPKTHSIQDFQLSQQLHFQHPNQQQANINQVEIRDQDL